MQYEGVVDFAKGKDAAFGPGGEELSDSREEVDGGDGLNTAVFELALLGFQRVLPTPVAYAQNQGQVYHEYEPTKPFTKPYISVNRLRQSTDFLRVEIIWLQTHLHHLRSIFI